MTAQPNSIDFTVGSRRLFSIERALHPVGFTLEDALAGTLPSRTSTDGADGLCVRSAPLPQAEALLAAFPDHVAGAREDFRRHYILMDGSFEDYLTRFSGKTRSTLRRKAKKFAQADGGELDVRAYTSADEVARFLELALPLSEKTYQARLLDAGLPDSEGARTAMLSAAA